MDIQDIEIFARVAAIQNLSAVGTELGLTPGTISKRLQALEEELSVRLFERTTRSIRITEEGSRFLGHVETILAELELARAAVAESVGRPKGKLRIAASHALASRYIAPAVLQFLVDFPDIDVSIDFKDQPVNLQESGYDVAIHAGALSDSALIAKRLVADQIILVAAPAYLKQHGPIVAIDDLMRHACLALGDETAWVAVRDSCEQTVRVRPRVKSDNADFLRHVAIEGHGILRASALHVYDDVQAGRLVPVLPEHVWGASAGVWALYPSSKHVLPRLRVFLDFLACWFRSHSQTTPGATATLSRS
jgi:DNA-binding transcriptional LysR family regulator